MIRTGMYARKGLLRLDIAIISTAAGVQAGICQLSETVHRVLEVKSGIGDKDNQECNL